MPSVHSPVSASTLNPLSGIAVESAAFRAVSSQLARTLSEAQAHSDLVVLDMRELTFMDTAGAHVIIDAAIKRRQFPTPELF
jgi:hypothetical protein